MTDELREELKQVRHEQAEYAEVEGDLHRVAQFWPHGGLMYRFFMWCYRKAKSERELRARWRKEIEEEIRQSER